MIIVVFVFVCFYFLMLYSNTYVKYFYAQECINLEITSDSKFCNFIFYIDVQDKTISVVC